MTFFTKPDCGLCRAALYVVERVRRAVRFELRIVDISAAGEEAWRAAYHDHIPVVHLNGREVFRHRVEEAELRRLVAGEAPAAESGA
ncbi:MAG: glutaredoxin family protein [Planctomycetes bacterium]|nr:glutaredoxin family protein [Planctomycetota bacterium]